ncbi:major facilitator superfamily domain-containing protein 1-like [Ruditapes philippinarum]|uniref:major facilitator superfamily domain-containing protein 1-like n=1 Tax=Ruditapes philippinarum TaxID=129788 RepID=UPI00295BB871|nr:major facilitator superfamily domain-containing protein 1-like [Ruditapes philippinarum]
MKEESQALLGEKETGRHSKMCLSCDPKSRFHLYILLVFICLIGVGDYFCTDSPAALQNHFLEDLKISETKYMSFYSNIQWTSIVSCLFGGFLIDRVFGNRIGITMFSIAVTCAHGLFSMGALLNSYWIMFVARAVYGFVNGPMAIANDNMAVKWFKTTNINMVFGLKTSIARVSSVVDINVMDSLYNYIGQVSHGHICLGLTLLTGVVVAFLSFLSSVVVACLDKRADRMSFTLEEIKIKHDAIDQVSVSDVKNFPITYWLIAMTTTCYYLALFPFVGLGQVFYEMKYEREPQQADSINSMVYLMAAITMPLFGYMIDKFGKSLIWMFVGIILSIGSHIILAFTFLEPYIATVSMGLGYSIFTATMWPMASFVIPFNHLGTAYGIMNAMTAVGQTGAAYFAGYLTDNYGYLVLEVFFTACMTVSLILGCLLIIINQSRGGDINLSAKERACMPRRQTIEKTVKCTDRAIQKQNIP